MKMEETTILYISYRLSLGERARTISFILKNFCGYIGADRDLTTISEKECNCYLNAHGIREGIISAYWFSIYAALNGLFMWAIARGYMVTNPLPKDKPKEPEAFVPYIYSNEDLKRIFETALTYRRRFNIEYPEVIQVMLKLTYCLGLRPSETTHLVVDDINLQDGLAFIRETKFYKSRVVPFGREVSQMLGNYLRWRSEAVVSRGITDNHLFIKPVSTVTIMLITMSGFKIFATPLPLTGSPNGIGRGRTCKLFFRYCPLTWATAILTVLRCISLLRISYWTKLVNASNHT